MASTVSITFSSAAATDAVANSRPTTLAAISRVRSLSPRSRICRSMKRGTSCGIENNRARRHARRGRHDRGDVPDPSHVWRRAEVRVLVYAPDEFAVGEHVIVLVRPLAGRA
jgi:hypothetical protein